MKYKLFHDSNLLVPLLPLEAPSITPVVTDKKTAPKAAT